MVRLIEPSAEYLDSYIEAYDENAVAGITAHRFRDARKEDVLARFDAYAHERDLPPNRVGAHFYWLVTTRADGFWARYRCATGSPRRSGAMPVT